MYRLFAWVPDYEPAIWFPQQIKYGCFLYEMETFFSNTKFKSMVKHHLLPKWDKYTAVAGDGQGLLILRLSFT